MGAAKTIDEHRANIGPFCGGIGRVTDKKKTRIADGYLKLTPPLAKFCKPSL
jgi:hypothetical protein